MSDELKTLLKETSDRVEAPPGDIDAVMRGGRRRLTLAAAGALAAVAIAAVGAWSGLTGDGTSDLQPIDNPNRPSDEVGLLPDHLVRLRSTLPEEAVHLATRDLVLLYEQNGDYHGFFEGILRHSCPVNAPERACFATALKIVVDAEGEKHRGSDLLELQVPDDARVLWRGEPALGFIGVESINACDRMEKFRPYFRCRDGVMTYLSERERIQRRLLRAVRSLTERIGQAQGSLDEKSDRHGRATARLQAAREQAASPEKIASLALRVRLLDAQLDALTERLGRLIDRREQTRERTGRQ